MNIVRMNVIYSVFCNQINSSIETMEYLLFLVQEESITNLRKPLFRNKIFINNEQIRITYISDLLRVGNIINIMYMGYHINKFDSYIRLMFKYSAFSENEIKKLALDKIKDKELNPKYFTYGQYNKPFMRRLARYTMNSNNHPILLSVKAFFITPFSFIMLICIISALIYLKCIEYKILMNKVYPVLCVNILFIVVYVIWTYLWMRPTDYEKRNSK